MLAGLLGVFVRLAGRLRCLFAVLFSVSCGVVGLGRDDPCFRCVLLRGGGRSGGFSDELLDYGDVDGGEMVPVRGRILPDLDEIMQGLGCSFESDPGRCLGLVTAATCHLGSADPFVEFLGSVLALA
ncbi:hypothetical protein ABR737_41065 [Streptomyces sp. Edi2]